MESVDVFNIFRSEFVEYRINSVLLVIAERFISLNIEWMSSRVGCFWEICRSFCGCSFRVGLNHDQIHRLVIWIYCIYKCFFNFRYLCVQNSFCSLCPNYDLINKCEMNSCDIYCIHFRCSKWCSLSFSPHWSFSFIEWCVKKLL